MEENIKKIVDKMLDELFEDVHKTTYIFEENYNGMKDILTTVATEAYNLAKK